MRARAYLFLVTGEERVSEEEPEELLPDPLLELLLDLLLDLLRGGDLLLLLAARFLLGAGLLEPLLGDRDGFGDGLFLADLCGEGLPRVGRLGEGLPRTGRLGDGLPRAGRLGEGLPLLLLRLLEALEELDLLLRRTGEREPRERLLGDRDIERALRLSLSALS